MKIYDCFQFLDEEMLLDLRLNIMDKYVDKFVITEAKYSHSGEKKKLNFDLYSNSKRTLYITGSRGCVRNCSFCDIRCCISSPAVSTVRV